MKAEDFGYVVKNNLCLFQKGPLSQWFGAWKGQNGGFDTDIDSFYFNPYDSKRYHFLKNSYKDNTIRFNCGEQWMMASKALLFDDTETFKKIMSETSPKEQKALGRQVKGYDQIVWDEHKYNVVIDGNRIKFEKNKDLKEFLLSFNVHTIFAEAAPWDDIWGIGLAPDNPKALDINTWEGENLLGRAISEVRKEWAC